jgi:hypothetical protein
MDSPEGAGRRRDAGRRDRGEAEDEDIESDADAADSPANGTRRGKRRRTRRGDALRDLPAAVAALRNKKLPPLIPTRGQIFRDAKMLKDPVRAQVTQMDVCISGTLCSEHLPSICADSWCETCVLRPHVAYLRMLCWRVRPHVLCTSHVCAAV